MDVAAVRWQFLCPFRSTWTNVSAEEAEHLEDAFGQGHRWTEYRLKTGVPIRVDFSEEVRVNLASRRSMPLRKMDATTMKMEMAQTDKRMEQRAVTNHGPRTANAQKVSESETESESEVERMQQLLPQPVEILSAQKSHQWLLSEGHRQQFLRSPRLRGKHQQSTETREEQVPMDAFLDACKHHFADAQLHIEKGRNMYHDAQDPVAFESAGKCFALGIGELNKVRAVNDLSVSLSNWDGIKNLQEEHRSLMRRCFLNLAMCNLRASHFQEALENSDQALNLEHCAQAFYRKAMALEGLGRPEAAVVVWRQAAKVAPNDLMVRKKLVNAVANLKKRRDWEKKAFRGVMEDNRSNLELRAKTERLRTILGKACEYLGTTEVEKREVVEICDSLEAGSFSETSLAALQQLFTKCLEVSPMSTPDLVLSLEEVSFLSSLGVSLPTVDSTQRQRARDLLQKLQRGEELTQLEEQFLRQEQQKLHLEGEEISG